MLKEVGSAASGRGGALCGAEVNAVHPVSETRDIEVSNILM